MYKKEKIVTITFIMFIVVGQFLYGAVTDEKANTWSLTDKFGGINFSQNMNGAVTLSFNQQYGPPSYSSGMALADAGNRSSSLYGDYITAGIKGISFKIVSSGYSTSRAAIILQSSNSDRVWMNQNVGISADAGVWVINNISLNRTNGWICGDAGDLDALWNTDLQNIGRIGIRLTQLGSSAQAYSIDEFMLKDIGFVGVWQSLISALEAHFGVTGIDQLTEAQKKQDSDGDGMTDMNEILAGMDPNDANSVFTARIIPDKDNAGITIEWPCVLGARYSVLRATSLTSGFNPLVIGLVANDTGFMKYNDATATGAGPYFYKVMTNAH